MKERSKEEATRLYDEVQDMYRQQNTTGSIAKIEAIEKKFKAWKAKNGFHWQDDME